MASSTSGVLNLDEISIEGAFTQQRQSPRIPQNLPAQDIKPSGPTGVDSNSLSATRGVYSPGTLTTTTRQIPSVPAPAAPAESAVDALREQMAESQQQYKNERLAQAGIQAAIEIMNAQSRYNQVSASTRLNMMQLQNQLGDAVSRGQSRALGAESEGVDAGQSALLALAAQGQDVRGAGAQRVQSSYEAVGAYNAMIEEINMYREMEGLELQQVQQQYALESAENQRNMSYLSSALSFGTSYYIYR